MKKYGTRHHKLKESYNVLTTECENCGEPLDSFDPLGRHVWCDKCRMRAEQIGEKAQRELALFGDLLRKIRVSKEKGIIEVK